MYQLIDVFELNQSSDHQLYACINNNEKARASCYIQWKLEVTCTSVFKLIARFLSDSGSSPRFNIQHWLVDWRQEYTTPCCTALGNSSWVESNVAVRTLTVDERARATLLLTMVHSQPVLKCAEYRARAIFTESQQSISWAIVFLSYCIAFDFHHVRYNTVV